jgi:hypothetical protein
MTHPVNYDLANAFPVSPWLFLPAELGEVIPVLRAALGDDWVVEEETDCAGEVSIIAFPVGQGEGTPSFILFGSEGRARLAAIIADEWKWDRAFASFPEAVDAFIGEAMAHQPIECPIRIGAGVQTLENAFKETVTPPAEAISLAAKKVST